MRESHFPLPLEQIVFAWNRSSHWVSGPLFLYHLTQLSVRFLQHRNMFFQFAVGELKVYRLLRLIHFQSKGDDRQAKVLFRSIRSGGLHFRRILPMNKSMLAPEEQRVHSRTPWLGGAGGFPCARGGAALLGQRCSRRTALPCAADETECEPVCEPWR